MFKRSLELPPVPSESFFLWGPRQTGKSTLIKAIYPNHNKIDLLQTNEYFRYSESPSLLREEILSRPKTDKLFIIDEIQKVPALLNEVHWLIENNGNVFAMCGSSARKLRKAHANLLGGRAVRYELSGLVSNEIGSEFDLTKMVNDGYLPRHYLSSQASKLIRAYVQDYLKEEIANEGLVRNLPAFSQFLNAAVFSDTELVNFSNIGRECGVSPPTAQEYFQILVDTLLGRFLPAYTKRPKRRVIQSPKFYFSDVGIVNFLAKRGKLQPGSELFGKAFENWVFHELIAYSQYRERYVDFSYWRLASGIEVDLIINDMEFAFEIKSSASLKSSHLSGLRELIEDHPRLKKRWIVCMEPKRRITSDQIEILPYQDFIQELWSGNLF
jgi:predicted AAA+ superfamily ATPase